MESSYPNSRKWHLAHPVILMALVCLAGLALRITVCVQLSPLPSVQSPHQSTDMATYIRLAREISQGQWPDHFDYQPFYYSIFLPFCRLFTGNSPWAAMVLQAILGSAAVFLTGLCTAKLYGRRAGIAAAILLAFSKIHVFYTPFMLLEVLQSFWLILILWLTFFCWKQNRIWQWCCAALAISFATLTRGNAMLVLPAFLLLAIVRNWHKKLRGSFLALAVILIFELPQLPFSIRNWHYTGRWCGASTAGEKVLALGNTPEAPPGGLEYPLTYHKWCEDADKRPDQGRISVPANILKWAAKEPLAFLELKFRALLLFWDKQEIPNNVSLVNEGQKSPILHILIPFAILGPLAIFGLCISVFRIGNRKKACVIRTINPMRLFFLYLLLVSWLGTALFYNLARFRLSALPFICIAGGAAIQEIIQLFSRIKALSDDSLRRKATQIAALLGLASIFIVCAAFTFYQTYCEPAFMRINKPNGIFVNFTDTALLYDHGPLSLGGLTFIETPPNGLIITKKLVVPSDLKGEAAVRLPVIPPAGGIYATLSHNGQSFQLTNANIIRDRFLTWLEVKIPKVHTDSQGVAQFTWNLPGTPGLGIGIDRLRDYGRSTFSTPGNVLPLYSEAAMEAQWQK